MLAYLVVLLLESSHFDARCPFLEVIERVYLLETDEQIALVKRWLRGGLVWVIRSPPV